MDHAISKWLETERERSSKSIPTEGSRVCMSLAAFAGCMIQILLIQIEHVADESQQDSVAKYWLEAVQLVPPSWPFAKVLQLIYVESCPYQADITLSQPLKDPRILQHIQAYSTFARLQAGEVSSSLNSIREILLPPERVAAEGLESDIAELKEKLSALHLRNSLLDIGRKRSTSACLKDDSKRSNLQTFYNYQVIA